MEKKLSHPGFWLAVGMVLLVVAIQVALTIPLAIVDVVAGKALHRPTLHLERQPLAIASVNIAAFGAIILLGLRLNRLSFRQAFPRCPVPYRQMLGLFIAVLGADILLSEVDNVFRKLFPPPQLLLDLLKEVFFSNEGVLAKFFLLAIVAPVTEELLFRGLILRGLLNRYRPTLAVTLTALLFAAIHLNPWQFLSALFLGIMFGWLYLRTASIWLCVLGHAISNALFVVLPRTGLNIPGFTGEPDFSKVVFQPWWFDLTGSCFLLAGVWMLFKLTSTPQNQTLKGELN